MRIKSLAISASGRWDPEPSSTTFLTDLRDMGWVAKKEQECGPTASEEEKSPADNRQQ